MKLNSNSTNLRKNFVKLFNTNGNNLECFIKENIFFFSKNIFRELQVVRKGIPKFKLDEKIQNL